MNPTTRRDFLKTSAALAATATLSTGVHAAGSDVLKVGLIGCGSRGTGAAEQALYADKNVKLVAMGDAFADRLEDSLKILKAGGKDKDADLAKKVDVKDDHKFVGFDAYKQVIDSGVDVVLLTAPPGFRPPHLKYAIEKGKHVFCEKPIAVDAPGVRSVLATCEEAKKKRLSVVSGLCIRYDQGFRDTIKKIHEGAIGDVLSMQANDLRGKIWVKPRQPDWSDMVYQMRNWYYFAWLSGDFNVEQHVHMLDVAAWVMKDQYPIKAYGLGGRSQRTGPEYGHIFDHHSVVYEYANGSKLYALCRQQDGLKGDISVSVMGSKGTGVLAERRGGLKLTGPDMKYVHTAPVKDMYQVEHDEMFAAIRADKPINNGEYMSYSSLMAIVGRMATYTGQVIDWKAALNSKEDLSPPAYDWNVKLPTPPVAVPGVTKFV
ncbi:MAG: Gfo/Idh/MocA family oxidoreductase [Gemmataceae bacterium]|nr:Gfo/Idh/MocA family oxidoreductase [Gemmataceae bacterium]